MRRELPIVVAAFADEEQVHEALGRLEALNLARDLMGVCLRVNGRNGHSEESVHLLSVLAPSRLHGDVKGLLLRCDALSIGSAAEMSAAFGATPHPGVFEDGGMKLPLGLEYLELPSHGA